MSCGFSYPFLTKDEGTRMARRTRTTGMFLIAAAACANASPAFAAKTVWTNPDGGLWSDPSNWSDGVPTSADDVVLPQLDADGYVIQCGDGIACSSVVVDAAAGRGGTPGPIELHGGTLAVSSIVSVAGPGTSGLLRLVDHHLTAPFLKLGVGLPDQPANADLVLAGSATIGASQVLLAINGTASLSIGPGAHASAAFWSNSPTTHLALDVAQGSGPLIDAGQFWAAGELSVTLAGGWAIPSPKTTLVAASAGLVGTFAEIDSPQLDGHPLTVVDGTTSLYLPALDPVMSASLGFDSLPPMIGFENNVRITTTYASGLVQEQCVHPWSWCPWSLEVTSGAADFGVGQDDDVLFIEASGDIAIHASLTPDETTPPFDATFRLSAVETSPYVYQRVMTTADGAVVTSGFSPIDAAGPRASVDLRFVVFPSSSDDLGCDPHPGASDLFVKDRLTGEVDCVSPTMSVTKPQADIDADGRLVTFVAGPSGSEQVWLFDRWTRETVLVSRGPDGGGANGTCSVPRLSADGSTLVFLSRATDLGPPTIAGVDQVYGYDVASGAITLLSADPAGLPGASPSLWPSVSGDGSLVVFESKAANLAPDGGGFSHVLLRDRRRGTLEVVDHDANGQPFMANGSLGIITPSGRYVTYTTRAVGFGPSDGGQADAVLVDREAGTTEWMSPTVGTQWMLPDYVALAVSPDGEYVLYGGPLVPAESPPTMRAVRVRRGTLDWEWVNSDPWGEPTTLWGSLMQLSPGGDQALFFGPTSGMLPFAPESEWTTLVRIFHAIEPADINADGVVNGGDLAILLGAWGTTGSPADLDGDGVVGAADLAMLLGAWSN